MTARRFTLKTGNIRAAMGLGHHVEFLYMATACLKCSVRLGFSRHDFCKTYPHFPCRTPLKRQPYPHTATCVRKICPRMMYFFQKPRDLPEISDIYTRTAHPPADIRLRNMGSAAIPYKDYQISRIPVCRQKDRQTKTDI